MNFSSCQHPYEPCIDCSESELSFIGPLSGSRDVFKDPQDLGGAEICIDDKPCLASDQIGTSVSLEAVAEFRGSSVLPYDCVINGFSCFCVPYYCGLSLIRDAYGCNVESVDVDGSDSLGNDRCL